jgi:peroxiredoxin Q/BCP
MYNVNPEGHAQEVLEKVRRLAPKTESEEATD